MAIPNICYYFVIILQPFKGTVKTVLTIDLRLGKKQEQIVEKWIKIPIVDFCYVSCINYQSLAFKFNTFKYNSAI